MKLISYNIQYGLGRDGRVDLQRIADTIAGADLVALQEVERFWQRSGNQDQVAVLAGMLPDYHWVYGPGVDVYQSTPRADGRPANRRRQFGNLLLSRSPILSSRNHLLPKYATIEPMSIQRSALEAVVDTGSRVLRFYSVHLTHLASETRLPQVRRLLEIQRQACSEGMPMTGNRLPPEWHADRIPTAMPRECVLLGDFNMRPESVEYRELVGGVSDYGGRMSNPEGLVDAWTALGHPVDEGDTGEIRTESARLDYCFVSSSLATRLQAIEVDRGAQGSDHYPLRIDIDI